MNRNGLRLHGKAPLLTPGSELSPTLWHWSSTSRCRQIITLMTFPFFTHSTGQRLSEAGEQHIKPQNTSARLFHQLTTWFSDHHLLQSPQFGHELLWGMCISAQIIFSCWNSQPLHTPVWAGFWTSVKVSLFQEAIQAQVLNYPVCYWCCSCRNWFPACQIQALYAKNLTLNGISEFYFFFFQEPLQSWEKQQVF